MSANASVRTFNPEAVATLTKGETRKLAKLGFTAAAAAPQVSEPLPPIGGTGVTQGVSEVQPKEYIAIPGPEMTAQPASVTPAQKIMEWIKQNPLVIGGTLVVIMIAFVASSRK